MPLSPLLSNFFLGQFDLAAKRKKLNIIRYADDIIVLCKDREECIQAEIFIRGQLDKLNLSIPQIGKDKTCIVPPSESALFLGVHLKKKNDEYVKSIPGNTINKLLEKQKRYKDISFCISEDVQLPGVIALFENQLQGYRSSYKGADNIDKFIKQFEQGRDEVVEHLLISLFGAEKIKALDNKKRKFLGL